MYLYNKMCKFFQYFFILIPMFVQEMRRPVEDLDEYEEEDGEQDVEVGGGDYEEEEEDYEEEEEDPKPTKEELEYLELRQKLKEAVRKQMKKESGSGQTSSQEKLKKLPYDK